MTSAPGVLSTDSVSTSSIGKLTISHLFGFLLGHRRSIVAAARDRSTLWVGLLFVIAAGVAREYDGEDLRREPWHLLIPLAASLVLSFALFVLLRFRTRPRSSHSFWTGYRQFLGLFWLTAPLALLYAIPYERMLMPADAVSANLWTLALVAAWRVALMTRVIAVLTGWSAGASFSLVMLVAEIFALAMVWMVPLPVWQVMGGIEITNAERRLQSVGFMLRVITVVALPICLLAGAAVLSNRKPASVLHAAPNGAIALGPLCLAGAFVLLWIPILPAAQREQRLRSDAERLLRGGGLSAALAEMSRHSRADYPPAWDPPPRLGWAEAEIPPVLDIMRILAAEPAAPWVREIYLDKFERRWMTPFAYWRDGSLATVNQLLDALPEGPALREKHLGLLQRIEASERRDDSPSIKPTTGGAL